MRVHLTNVGAVSLLDPFDFKRLDVLVDNQPEDCLDAAIARIGSRDGDDHVFIAPSVMRFLSGHAGDQRWESGFSEMLFFAEQAGWVDAEGNVKAHITRSSEDKVVSQDVFKAAMRALPAGVSAITTGTGDGVAGMIVSSLTSVSAEPPLVGFFVHMGSSMMKPLLDNGSFAANILGSCHTSLMSKFLSEKQGPDRFKNGNWVSGASGLPILSDALANIECDIVSTTVLGTHRLVVGKIRNASVHEKDPMIHFNSCTRKLECLSEKNVA